MARTLRARMRAGVVFAALLCTGWSGISASAHPHQPEDHRTTLKPIEAGVGDRPLSSDGRRQPRDLRRPVGFDRVYEIMDDGKPTGVFARVDGGLTAVFKRSVYQSYRGRAVPRVPPGTVYKIGGVPDQHRDSTASVAVEAAIPDNAASFAASTSAMSIPDRSASSGLVHGTVERSAAAYAPPLPPKDPDRFWSDPQFRAERVGERLEQALRRSATASSIGESRGW